MPLLKFWTKASREIYLNIKRVILFPLIVYLAYLLMDIFMPLFMVRFIVCLLYSWTGKWRFC